MNTVFISHSHVDAPVATEIRDWLHAEQFHSLFVAFDSQDGISPGSAWENELLRNLRRCDVVLALCSHQYSISRWCFAELVYAKAHQKPIIPIRLDDSPPHELVVDTQAVDFSQHATAPHDTYAQLKRALTDRGVRPQIGGRWTGERSPYPGLAAFEEADAPVFFGRADEARDALAELRRLRRPDASHMLIMLGASGCGKSSLLRAGILPRLRADIFDWLVVDLFRPGAQPLTRMAQALAATLERRGKPCAWQDIREVLRSVDPTALRDLGEELRYSSRAPDARVLLIVDQLEEALVQPSAGLNASALDETAPFFALLRQLAAMREGSYFVLCTLRSDFLGAFQTHPSVQGVGFATLAVAAPSKTGFTRLIEAPAKLAGLELEPGLAELMVADTATPDALPLLAFTLRELYEKHARDRRLTIEEYRASPPAGLGGLQGAIAQAAENVIHQQNPPLAADRLDALRHTFLSMVALNEGGEPARRPLRWSAISPVVHLLVEHFVQARLLVARETDGEREVDVVHETLFRSWGRLRDWLAENRAFLLWRKDLERQFQKWQTVSSENFHATASSEHPRATARLLRDDDLARARANLTRYGDVLSADERDYIQMSVDADRRRRRLVRGAVAAVIILLAGAALYARQQSGRAAERASAAKQATLLASARSFKEDPTRAGALMRESNAATNEFRGAKATILDGHSGPLRAVAFSPDSRLVVTSSEDGTARIWNADGSGEPIILKVNSPVTVATFDPTGRRIATGSDDETVRLWSVDSSGEPTTLDGHWQAIAVAVFSADGTRLATAARRPIDFLVKTAPDNTVRVWELASSHVTILSGHTSTIVGTAFLPSGTEVVSASEDGTARIWDVNDPERPVVLRAGEPITALAVSPDGRTIVAGCRSGTIRVWANAPAWTPRVVTGHTGAVTGILFAADGAQMVTRSEDETARIWQLGPGALPQTSAVLSGRPGGVTAMAFSPDGSQVLTASADNKARMWTRDGKPSSGLSTLLNEWLPLTAKAEDSNLVSFLFRNVNMLSMTDQVRRFDAEWASLSGHDARITAVAWSPDGRRIVTASADNSARIWRLDGPTWLSVLRSRTSGHAPLTLSVDGERLLDVKDGIAQVKYADGSGTPIALPQPDRAVAVAFGADTDSVLTGSTNGTIRMWKLDRSDPRVVGVLNHKSGAVEKLLLDRDSKRLAAFSARVVTLWDIGDPQRASEILTISDVSGGRFTPDGTHFVAERTDTFQVIDTYSGESRVLLSTPGDVRERSGFRLTTDGRSIVSCLERAWNERPPIYLRWNMRSNHDPPMKLIDYKLDGNDLTAPGDKRVRLDPEGASVGDPCAASSSRSVDAVVTSANGRRIAVRLEEDTADDTQKTHDVWTIVATLDAQTQLWREIDYCFSARDRMTWLGETAREADQARQCCQRTVGVCRDATFDACAALVKRNYADPINPCSR